LERLLEKFKSCATYTRLGVASILRTGVELEFLSRRDGMKVASPENFRGWNGYQKGTRPVGYGVIGRRETFTTASRERASRPTGTVPYGTGRFFKRIPGPAAAHVRQPKYLFLEVWWGEAPDRLVSGCGELRPVELPGPLRPLDVPSRGLTLCSYIGWGLEKW